MEELKVYGFFYCDCIHEPFPTIVSLHRTKKGAYLAMKSYLNREYDVWRQRKRIFKFGEHSTWHIGELILNG